MLNPLCPLSPKSEIGDVKDMLETMLAQNKSRIGKQPLLSNTSSAADGLTRGVWNAVTVNDMTPGGLDDLELPDIIVNSADQGYWVQVSDRVRHALERGRPISEVMLIAAEAADDMNAAIADGEVAVQPCF